MRKASFSTKKRILTFTAVLALAGFVILIFGYVENIVGAEQARVDVLRLFVILMVAALAALGGVSLGRFEDEIESQRER